MKRKTPSLEHKLLLQLVDEAYERKAWHGPNLQGSVRGLSAEEAAWRPAPGRHNIWEIVIHAADWKYVVRRRLLGEKRGSFPLMRMHPFGKGSNWFKRPSEMDEERWREDVRMLEAIHRSMRDAIAGLNERELQMRPPGAPMNAPSNAALIHGTANHDVYHAGQIQLLKRMQR